MGNPSRQRRPPWNGRPKQTSKRQGSNQPSSTNANATPPVPPPAGVKVPMVKEQVLRLIQPRVPLDTRAEILSGINALVDAQEDYLKRNMLRQDLYSVTHLREAMERCQHEARGLHASHQLPVEIRKFRNSEANDLALREGDSGSSPLNIFIAAFQKARGHKFDMRLLEFLQSLADGTKPMERDWVISFGPKSPRKQLSGTASTLEVATTTDSQDPLTNRPELGSLADSPGQSDEEVSHHHQARGLLKAAAPLGNPIPRRPRSLSRMRSARTSSYDLGVVSSRSSRGLELEVAPVGNGNDGEEATTSDERSRNPQRPRLPPINRHAPDAPPPPFTKPMARIAALPAVKAAPVPSPLARTPAVTQPPPPAPPLPANLLAPKGNVSGPPPPPAPPLPPNLLGSTSAVKVPPPPPPPPPANLLVRQGRFTPAHVTKSTESWRKDRKTSMLRSADWVEGYAIQNESTIWNDPELSRPDFSEAEQKEASVDCLLLKLVFQLLCAFEMVDKAPHRKTGTIQMAFPASPLLKTPVSARAGVPASPAMSAKRKPILDDRQAMQIAFPLKTQLRGSTVDAWIERVKASDGQLNIDTLAALIKAWPTDTQLLAFEKVEREDLHGNEDLFCWEVSRQKNLKPRCQLIVAVADYEEKIRLLSNATDELEKAVAGSQSEAIKQLLTKCLNYGNFLNQGSTLANRAGYRLTALKSILEFKNQRGRTIVSIIAEHTSFEVAELEGLAKDLLVKADLKESEDQAKKWRMELTAHLRLLEKTTDTELQERFTARLKAFSEELDDVVRRLAELRAREKELLTYFCAMKMSIEKMFGCLAECVTLWVAAIKQLAADRQREEKEEKRRQYAATHLPSPKPKRSTTTDELASPRDQMLAELKQRAGLLNE
ncbi:unnamed protein product, partial [Mesorhabditis spiculigera]